MKERLTLAQFAQISEHVRREAVRWSMPTPPAKPRPHSIEIIRFAERVLGVLEQEMLGPVEMDNNIWRLVRPGLYERIDGKDQPGGGQ